MSVTAKKEYAKEICIFHTTLTSFLRIYEGFQEKFACRRI